MIRIPALMVIAGLFLPGGRANAEKSDGERSGHHAGWVQRAKLAPTREVTAHFVELYKRAKAGKSSLPNEAKNHVYLLVGGLFTRHYPGYMGPNLRALKKLGLNAVKSGVNTDLGVDANAKFLREEVIKLSETGKKVVLVGQSKGGVDITAALALYPELKPHVRAVVLMQAPYGGTPIASDINNSRTLKKVAGALMKMLLGGKPEALSDLSYKARRAFVAAHPYPTDVPTVSLATSRASLKSLLKSTQQYLSKRYKLLSDGLVVNHDAEIPGSKVVRLNDMDHAESVMAVPFRVYRAGALTVALVLMALER